MRLDHIAYRVADRNQTAVFLKETLGYQLANEFDIQFEDGSIAECLVLDPPSKSNDCPPPEIFVSNGSPDSIVGKWVKERGGIGGIHHLAYQVVDIESKVKAWKEKGIEFLTKEVIDCPDDEMRQIFTKPLIELGGVIVELIERGDKGFCKNSVKGLMQSTEEA